MMQRLFIKSIGFFIPFLGLFVFLWMDIQPDGVLRGELEPGVRTPRMHHPLPDTRIKQGELNGEKAFVMTGEPAYVSLRLPKTAYDEVVLGVEFLPVNQTVFEIGPEHAPDSQAFELKPLFQEAIERLDWSMREVEGGFVYEESGREGATHSRATVATYAYDWQDPYRDASYSPSGARTVYDVDLRGAHRIKTYIKNEALDMRLTFTDMNREVGRDDLVISVYDEEGRLVREIRQDDDGNERGDQQVTRYDISVYVADLEEGVYEITYNTTTDLFLRTIDTTQSRFVFLNRLYVGDAVGWREQPARTEYVGNGQAYTLMTLHKEGLQTVFFDTASVPLQKTHINTQFILEKPKDMLRMRIPQGDVSVVSEGVFALTPENFFVPDPRVVGPFTDIEHLGVEAVYSSYERLRDGGGDSLGAGEWMYAEQRFDARDWWERGRGSVRIALSAPFIATQEGTIYIKRITVRFEKTPIRSAGAFLRAIRERVPFGI